jgi:hypothetical protein
LGEHAASSATPAMGVMAMKRRRVGVLIVMVSAFRGHGGNVTCWAGHHHVSVRARTFGRFTARC